MHVSLVSSCTDSSQNDSLSDQEDHRPSFSMPSISTSSSFDTKDDDGSSQTTSKFSMYNSVSQKLMVIKKNLFFLGAYTLYCFEFIKCSMLCFKISPNLTLFPTGKDGFQGRGGSG